MTKNRSRATKTLFSNCCENVQIQIQTYYNRVTGSVGYSTGFKRVSNKYKLHTCNNKRIVSKLQRPKTGYVWHHVAYDFKRPDALVVEISKSQHASIHHPKGCKFGTYGYSLID